MNVFFIVDVGIKYINDYNKNKVYNYQLFLNYVLSVHRVINLNQSFNYKR